jgi:DNA-directed RNA polymerase specialized sigma24 family protein
MRTIRGAFKDLTKKQKDIWQLVMRENWSQARAARMLGITKYAACDRLHKAKRRVERYLKNDPLY